MRLVTVLSAIAVSASSITVVSARDTPQAIVQTDDLDLTKASDQNRLQLRIESKVRIMCRSNAGGPVAHKLDKQCRATAFADAQRQTKAAIAKARSDAEKVRLAADSPVATGA